MCYIGVFVLFRVFFELNGYICVILGMCALLTHISPYNSHIPNITHIPPYLTNKKTLMHYITHISPINTHQSK